MTSTQTMATDGDYEAPASSQQRPLWYLQQLNPIDCSYNENKALLLRGPLNVERLASAIEALASRHHVLRTIYSMRNDELVQRILPHQANILKVKDARAASKERVLEAISENAATPFDLNADIPLRAVLYRLDDNEHILHLCIHHIATDGWSWSLILNEIFNEMRGHPVFPPEIQYAEYSEQQRQAESDASLAPAVQYWKNELAGAENLDLPSETERAANEAQGATIEFELPPGTFARVQDLGRQEKLTPFAILLAAYKLTLARFAGQKDITVGIPISNRVESHLEDLVGMFVNTIAIRSELPTGATFREFVRTEWQIWLRSMEHQNLPIDYLVAELQPDRSVVNPVFQTLFSFLRAPQLNLDLPGVNVTLLPVSVPAARFPLELTLQEDQDGNFGGKLIYDPACFRPGTARALASLFVSLLNRVTQNPDIGLWSAPLLSPDETQLVLRDWNATKTDIPSCSVYELFEKQAAVSPDAIAIRDGSTEVTYGHLRDRADAVASRLLQLDVPMGTFIAVRMPRSVDYVVACLAVLKTGCGFVPVDMTLPALRQEFILRHCTAPVLLCDAQAPNLELPGGMHVEFVQQATNVTVQFARKAPPNAPVYVLYTSGSTGEPNGVVGTHQALVNRLLWMQSSFPLAKGDVCAAKTRIGFVDSLTEMLGPLLAGATLSIIGDDDAGDPKSLVQRLGEVGATRVVLVPSMLRAMIDSVPEIASVLPSLRFWVVSGETLTRDLAEKFHRTLPGCSLLNLYGSTEVCGDATFHEVRAGEAPSIGRPISNMRCYILDSQMIPLPPGLPGELYIGGAGLAERYLGNDALTQERFVRADMGELAEDRLFRTGDIARQLPDGQIEYLGRNDDQVKLRGLRIELGEIETALRLKDVVQDAVVLLPPGTDSLVAFVRGPTPDDDAEWKRKLRADLSQTLPAPFIPGRIQIVDDFPRTASGKVNRAACLAELGQSATKPANAATGELSLDSRVLEDRMSEIWRGVLKDPTIGKNADFFDMGGHSLLAVRLMDQVEKAFGVRLPLSLLFEAPTAGKLASRLLERPDRFSAFLLEDSPPDVLPLFCLRGLFHYRNLAKALKGIAPVYAVLLEGEEQLGEGFTADPKASFEALIDHYVDSVLRVSPEGPYYLAGLSAGGLLAIEVARRLKEMRKTVALVALLDTNAPGITLRKKFIDGSRNAVRAALGRNVRQRKTNPDIDLLYRSSLNSLSRVPYVGDILICRAKESSFGWRPRDLGWKRFISGKVTVLDVPGDHLSMMRDPNVAILARSLLGHDQLGTHGD